MEGKGGDIEQRAACVCVDGGWVQAVRLVAASRAQYCSSPGLVFCLSSVLDGGSLWSSVQHTTCSQVAPGPKNV